MPEWKALQLIKCFLSGAITQCKVAASNIIQQRKPKASEWLCPVHGEAEGAVSMLHQKLV